VLRRRGRRPAGRRAGLARQHGRAPQRDRLEGGYAGLVLDLRGERALPAPRRAPARRGRLLLFLLVLDLRLVVHSGLVEVPAEGQVAQLGQPLRDAVDGRRRHHQDAEDRQQGEQRYRDPVRHGVREQPTRQPAEQATGLAGQVEVGGLVGGDVQDPGGADEQRRPADHPAPRMRLLGRRAHQPYRADQQQHRQRIPDGAHEQPGEQRDVPAERPARAEPHGDGQQQRHPQYQQPGAVAAVLGVEVARVGGPPSRGADQPADPVRQTHPEQDDQPAEHVQGAADGRGPAGACVPAAGDGRSPASARLRGATRHAVTVTAGKDDPSEARRRGRPEPRPERVRGRRGAAGIRAGRSLGEPARQPPSRRAIVCRMSA
jgi:hypothetical protein